MKTKAVKIVQVVDGKLFSYSSSCYRDMNQVEYKVGEEVHPEKDCGPLACFTSLRDALRFFQNDFMRPSIDKCPWERYKIFWCEIEPLEITELWLGPENFNRFDVKGIPGSVTSWTVKLLDEVPQNMKYFEQLMGESSL